MTFSTKILVTALILSGSTVIAHAEVTAKDTDAVNFTPAAASQKGETLDQSALLIHDEVGNSQTEAGSCQIECHPAFGGYGRTSLAKFDLKKIE